MRENYSRRRVLSGSGAAISTVFAGCGGLSSRARDDETAATEVSQTGETGGTGGPSSGAFDAETMEQAASLGRTVQQSVVSFGHGTGFHIGEGQVVTNAHVVAGFPTVDVETFDGSTTTGQRVGYHQSLTPDVALVDAALPDVPALTLGDASSLTAGQPVVMVGHPGRVGTWVISIGRFERYEARVDWLLFDIPEAPGNSGSPVVTLAGDVVGVLSGSTTISESDRLDRSTAVLTAYPTSEKLGTVTPSSTIQRWVDEWTG